MENYLYDVFFKASNLSDVALKHIKRYFEVRYRECVISNEGNDIYKISFANKNEQKNVLDQRDHFINIPGQRTVRVKASANQTCVAVVEQHNQVDRNLESSSSMQEQQQVQQTFPVSEKHFALIKEQFELYKNSDLPTLQIEQEPDVILLKGPKTEVLKCYQKLSTLKQGIIENRLSNYAFMNFLVSSDSINHLQKRFKQSLKSPVMIEISGSDLLLLSLSDGALKEAANAIETDLCSETIHLKKSSDFATLAFELSNAVKQANRESVKVELKYQNDSNSDTEVQLVGFTTKVTELMNILLEYKKKHRKHHVCLRLQYPEMAKHFSKILLMAGVKECSVEIKPTCSSSPCVHLTGPRCEVETLESYLQCVVTRHLEVKGPGVQQFFQGDGATTLRSVKSSCQVEILPTDVPENTISSSASSTNHSMDYDNILHIKVVVGLEQQQADVFVVPMVNTNMTSTLIGSSLLNKAGQQLQTNFNTAKGNRTLKSGEVLEVDAPQGLGCSKVLFLECAPQGINHNCENALRCGLGQIFALCERNLWGSVALPIIEPEDVLSIPVRDSVNILTQQISTFLSKSTHFLHTIRIPIMPNYSHSEEMFQIVLGTLHALMVDSTGQALFHSLTTDLDEVIMAVDRIKLHLVFGDITDEMTDAIVNTTDFNDFQTNGACKDILTKAGPSVQSLLKGGQGGLDPKVVAKSILEGVKEGVQGANLQYLKNIRIILLKINVFLAFKTVARQVFGASTQMTAPAPLHLSRSQAPSSPVCYDLSSLLASLPVTEDKAAFLVIGDRDKDVFDACTELQRAYDSQCLKESFYSDEMERLTKDELNQLRTKVHSLHLQLEINSSGKWVAKGLKDGVNEVARLMRDALRRQVREKEQDNLFTQVAWCILGPRSIWQKVPKKANHQLERADVNDGIVDAQGVKWTVDLRKLEATECDSGQVTALKRLENLSDFSFPIHWDSMNQKGLKVVALDPQSAEYKTVKADFQRTVLKTVLKIERIQNINLRRLYEARKSELEIKNDPAVGAGEKILYHGSAQASCSSIMSTNFNRNFAGQNGTVYGQGTYFAVNASYSANVNYAVPAADGTQQMFVARVLTGHYTMGFGDMRTAPVRVVPDQFYDSVVDYTQNPTMFVVFHDCQAYPDYLITFK
ncbi:protein mono-ADP-ribosyltransferase PARP14 isoform X2 [Danio rerio]|uniref:Protein mono-ADP-ribosyltransferase PARP14 isoform X2 n=1 Tax=Danio rerio TaxID=7955 RepID=A0AC58G305_DANRE